VGTVELVETKYPVTPIPSEELRFRVAAVAVVLAALLLIVRVPVGGVVSPPPGSDFAAPLA
jgi:hypothetical protein